MKHFIFLLSVFLLTSSTSSAESIQDRIDQMKAQKKFETKKLQDSKAKLAESENTIKALEAGDKSAIVLSATDQLRHELAVLLSEVQNFEILIADEKQELKFYKEEEKIETLSLKSGQTYDNATLSTVTPFGISIQLSSGIKRISYSELPDEMVERFKFDDKEASFYSTEENRKRAMQSKITAEALKNQDITVSSYEERQISRLNRRIAEQQKIISRSTGSTYTGSTYTSYSSLNILKNRQARQASASAASNARMKIQAYRKEISKLEKTITDRK